MKGSLAAILLAGSLSLVTPRLWGQPLSLDSLLHELSTVKSSEGKYKILSSIAISYSDSSYSKSLEYWLEALEVAKKLESSKYTADILHQIGFTYLKMGEPKIALANFQNAAELYVSLNDNADLAGVYNDMGLIYRSWGRYDSALEFYLKSYKLYERLANAEGMAMASNSIGQIYYYRENYTKAVDYFSSYLEINQGLGNYRAVAGACNNIASAYMELNHLDRALDYYMKAFKIYDSLGVKIGVGIIQDNIGSLLYSKGDYRNALLYHFNALQIFNELKSDTRKCLTLKNIGSVYLKQNRPDVAVAYLNQSLDMAVGTGQKDVARDVHQTLANAYEVIGSFPKAYYHLKNYQVLKDSMLNAETIEKIETLQAQLEMENQAAQVSLVQHKLKLQRQVAWTVSGLLAMMGGLLVLLYRENKKKNAALAEEQKFKESTVKRLDAFLQNTLKVADDGTVGGFFSDSWKLQPANSTQGTCKLLSFKVNNSTLAFMQVSDSQRVSPNLITLCLCCWVKSNAHRLMISWVNFMKEMRENFAADPLTSDLDPSQYCILPFTINGDFVLNLTEEGFAVWHSNKLIFPKAFQCPELVKGDTLYLYFTTIGLPLPDREQREMEKIIGSVASMEFSLQPQAMQNLLKTFELENFTYIFALRI